MKRVFIYTVLLAIPVLCSALTPNDVYHNDNNIFYVNPSLHEVKLRLNHTGKVEVLVYIDTTGYALSSVYREDPYVYFGAAVPAIDRGVPYYFTVTTVEGSLRIPQIGHFTSTVPAFSTPEWSHGKVYYSIFPDGFFNGDPLNDPDKKG